jgi:hypothetical protein
LQAASASPLRGSGERGREERMSYKWVRFAEVIS